eukprot:12911639-Prorocentrum_lima.AAC.1
MLNVRVLDGVKDVGFESVLDRIYEPLPTRNVSNTGNKRRGPTTSGHNPRVERGIRHSGSYEAYRNRGHEQLLDVLDGNGAREHGA